MLAWDCSYSQNCTLQNYTLLALLLSLVKHVVSLEYTAGVPQIFTALFPLLTTNCSAVSKVTMLTISRATGENAEQTKEHR